jgi:hypothetical protein
MINEPFITDAERPDLTVSAESKVGDLTVRELQAILGIEHGGELKEGKDESKDQNDKKHQKD